MIYPELIKIEATSKTPDDIIMSIKPKYAKRIYEGTKFVEYRKSIPNKHFRYIFIYESSPVKRITGMFLPGHTHIDRPITLWRSTEKLGGISKEEFDLYFKDKSKYGYAIGVCSPVRFEEHYKLLQHPPQSWAYCGRIDDGEHYKCKYFTTEPNLGFSIFDMVSVSSSITL